MARLKSGGGGPALNQTFRARKNILIFEKIIVHTYENSEFKKFNNDRIAIKSHPYINKNIFYQIYWQRYILPQHLNNELLFTIDSTSFCRHKKYLY